MFVSAAALVHSGIAAVAAAVAAAEAMGLLPPLLSDLVSGHNLEHRLPADLVIVGQKEDVAHQVST